MDIETLAAERPEALARIRWIRWPGSTRPRPMRSSPRPASQAAMPQIARVLQLLGTVYEKEDATLVEVNPLIKTSTAGSSPSMPRFSLDENADFATPITRRWPTSRPRTRFEAA